MFSKSWKRSVKPSGLSWMEDMTTSSVSWHHVWDWRKQSWRTPYWKEIRQLGFILSFFLWKPFHITANWSSLRKLLWQLPHWTECIHFDFLLRYLMTFFYNESCVALFWQIDRMEQFFAAEGLPHLMFFYQEPEPVEAGNGKVLGKT